MSNDFAQFILIRTDMASMNAGKAMAQAAHGANTLDRWMGPRGGKSMKSEYEEWKKQTDNGFGTCLVYDGKSERDLEQVSEHFYSRVPAASFLMVDIFDPSYPVKDGDVVHHVGIHTGKVIFGERQEIGRILRDLGLELHS